jgi:hypothetical protein
VYVGFIGVRTNNLHGQLLSLKKNLYLAWLLGFKILICHLDSLDVVNTDNGHLPPYTNTEGAFVSWI